MTRAGSIGASGSGPPNRARSSASVAVARTGASPSVARYSRAWPAERASTSSTVPAGATGSAGAVIVVLLGRVGRLSTGSEDLVILHGRLLDVIGRSRYSACS